jgi:hypothetical protein
MKMQGRCAVSASPLSMDQEQPRRTGGALAGPVSTENSPQSDLVDVGTTAVPRRWLAGTITDERLEQAIEDVTDLPLGRFPTLG